jgi:hypothetical protein
LVPDESVFQRKEVWSVTKEGFFLMKKCPSVTNQCPLAGDLSKTGTLNQGRQPYAL